MTYAENTKVSVARSKAEIEDLLNRYGASSFASGWERDSAVIGFVLNERAIRFRLPLPLKDSFRQKMKYGKLKEVSDNEMFSEWEQACRTKWRALMLCIKAKLEACSSGITTLEDEFLAHFVVKGGKTIGETLLPQLDAIRGKNDFKLLGH